MSYIDSLKEAKAFDFENNGLTLNRIVLEKKTKTFNLDVTIDRALTLGERQDFYSKNNSLFEDAGSHVRLDVKYNRNDLSEDSIIEYVDFCIGERLKLTPLIEPFKDFKKQYSGNYVTVLVDEITDANLNIASDIEADLNNLYGLNVFVKLEESLEEKNKTLEAQALEEKKQELELREIKAKASEQEKAKEMSIKKDKNFKFGYTTYEIKNIPSDMEGLAKFQNEVGPALFKVVGYIFKAEVRDLKRAKLFIGAITDDSDSIRIKAFVRGDANLQKYNEIVESVSKGKLIGCEITGRVEYDQYEREVLLSVSTLDVSGVKSIDYGHDDAIEKRVELCCHTKLSNFDGLNEAGEYIKCAKAWGHKAMGFTDHNGVYVISDIFHATEKDKSVKPLYGCDLDYLDDKAIHITYGEGSYELKDATYVVFDIETTGFSQNYDSIIEIACAKVKNGMIIDQYDDFVKPLIPISERITSLTSITNDMVENAMSIEEALKKFVDYSKDCIIVAHNADFDIGFMRAKLRQTGIGDIDFAGIDTLRLMHFMYYGELTKFNLKAVSKFFKVKQDHHHRANDDTRVLAEAFCKMIQDVLAKGYKNYNELNNMIHENEKAYKNIIPRRARVIALNQTGYKNMFKMVSDALTEHVSTDARLLQSVVEKYHEGVLFLSGNSFGDVFENALNRSEEELKYAISKYDVIEVQPIHSYDHLINELSDVRDGLHIIQDTVKKIIDEAKAQGKIVVATSECYYINKEDKKYRNILIDSPKSGGGFHELVGFMKDGVLPDAHLRTTAEMLDEFNYLPKDLAYEIVVTNTNKVADMVEDIVAFKKGDGAMYVPADDEFADHPLPEFRYPSMVQAMKDVVAANVLERYGENVHPFVQARLDRELKSIISSGYYSTYFMAYLMVKDSLDHGYLVGSRGSVGSSLVANMMNITEVNALPPHYLCPKCKFMAIKFNQNQEEFIQNEHERTLQDVLRKVGSGYDLPDMKCPCCGEPMKKDGHDIPFETFLGFHGDKIPDIDLNFSGEYQPTAHLFVRKMMGYDNSFRGGTVGTVQDKKAYGYVKAYLEKHNIKMRDCEIDRIATKITGVKVTTGQHPGGIVVVPKRIDIFDVTPIQYAANDDTNEWRTTHFDYHAFEDNLLKLDVLGHDDPTLIKYFMDIVHEHQDEFPFSDPRNIPLDDHNVFGLFGSTTTIGLKPEQIDSKVASFAVPELGTPFVRQMLLDTMPKTFAELVKISGLSHGTGVWLGNAQDLVNPNNPTGFGTLTFDKVIGCRDDIMVDLMAFGLDPGKSFKIMEFVRKNKKAKDPQGWEAFKAEMREAKVPEYYIWSCEQIEYMFPKAHAIAYIIMALRIAWFKVYKPAMFYSAYLSKRAKAYDVYAMLGSEADIKKKISDLEAIGMSQRTAKDDDLITSLQVVLEAKARGIKFLPVDIKKSDSAIFNIEGGLVDGALRIPFAAVDGLGPSAAENIKAKREEKMFTSIEDVNKRTRLNQTLSEEFRKMGAFGDLPEEDPIEETGLFAF
ncbi:MAG: PolC-type DNA polymerase III [Acholeplasmatales bacterium]|nr:PolC-type DNA polymerase III [Acholeplasmatales bacterium]